MKCENCVFREDELFWSSCYKDNQWCGCKNPDGNCDSGIDTNIEELNLKKFLFKEISIRRDIGWFRYHRAI